MTPLTVHKFRPVMEKQSDSTFHLDWDACTVYTLPMVCSNFRDRSFHFLISINNIRDLMVVILMGVLICLV